MPTQPTTVQAAAIAVLSARHVEQKIALTQTYGAQIAAGALRYEHPEIAVPLNVPGRPDTPELVDPRALQARKLGTPAGRAALLHAVAHIEFNAINLAWDAVYRFADMPPAYYQDWASVAVDEARHFTMLQARLQDMGYGYGDFPAHNGLWEMALRTREDVLTRMALVPRLLEARGLDVTPAMITKLQAVGDLSAVAILQLILREEIGHVAIGSRWFAYACTQAKKPLTETFLELLNSHARGAVRGPFNRSARLAAGFSEAEVDALEQFHGG